MRLVVFGIICLAAGAACAQTVQVTDGWVHAVPPFQRVAGGHLTLKSETDDVLTGITINSGGIATLRKAGGGSGGVKLPAGKAVTLAPGGNAIDLVGDDAPLIPGSRVGMTLHFAHAPPETVELNVLSRGDNGE